MENPELNQTTEIKQPKNPLVKFITTVILIAVLVFLGWSATKLVKSFPESFDSLASIANKVYNFKTSEESDNNNPTTTTEILNSLTVSADRSAMESGEKLSIWWTTLPTNGNFTFSFRCQDGVTVAVQPDSANEFSDITCGDKYSLGLVDRIEILVTSTKNRFTDLDYTISYFPQDEVVASANNNLAVTIVNPNLSSSDNLSSNTGDNNSETEKNNVVENPAISEETISDIPTKNESTTDTPAEPSKPIENTENSPSPAPKPNYTWQVPVSNPNGYIDLTVSGLNIGFNDRFGNFINTGVINRDERGVIKFTVKNTGTKTSNNWTFSAILPGGITYQSPTQLPLKPQERATFTVQFDAVDKLSIETFSATVKTTSDLDSSNNTLEQSILVR